MKKTMTLLGLLLFVAGVYAQEENSVRDKKEETVTTVIVVNDGKEVKKIPVKEEVTTEKQEVRLKDQEDNPENQNVEYVPTESKKTVRRVNIDVPYANMAKRNFYTYNGRKYMFTPDKTGFFISYQNGNRQTRTAKIRKTNAKDHFLVTGNKFSGIGYFDEEGNFYIEYPDNSGDNMIVQKYVPAQ